MSDRTWTVAVDFDMTLTAGSPNPYQTGGEEPNWEMIERVRALKEKGKHDIIIWTARPWSHASHVAGLLTQWEVPFNGMKMQKGGAHAYIDDKAVNSFSETLDDDLDALLS